MHALQLLGYFQSYQLTWSYLLDQLVAGLTLGSLYGLMAIGYSMVYGVLKLLNFAHGEVFMIGAYISSFSLDIHNVKSAASIVAAYKARFNQDTISFGVPTWVAVQMMALAISKGCADGKITRVEARRDLDKVSIKTSIIGRPIAFTKNGDVKGGINFSIFQIGSDGKYNAVQNG